MNQHGGQMNMGMYGDAGTSMDNSMIRLPNHGYQTQQQFHSNPHPNQWNPNVNSDFGSQQDNELMEVIDPNDLAAAAARRNRGNYRCSKCGEPKKGHVCAYQPLNFKCNRCGNPKKTCTCDAPDTFSVGVQCEFDENMTTRVLDLNKQGVSEFHHSVMNFVGSGPNGASKTDKGVRMQG